MVKLSRGPVTPIEQQPPESPAPPEDCPALAIDVTLEEGASLRPGDAVAVQVRGGRARLLCRGQIVGWVDDGPTVNAISRCQEAGVHYEGTVASIAAGHAVFALESRR